MRIDKTQAALGSLIMLLIGVGIAFVLHSGLGRAWSEILVPVGAYLTIQMLTLFCSSWARTWIKKGRNYGPMVALIGCYAWGSGLLVIHYGTEWGLLKAHDSDSLSFSVFMIFVIALSFALFSRFKGGLNSTR